MDKDGFDLQVIMTLEKQGESIGLKITSGTGESKDAPKKSQDKSSED
jgi:hypothetical protein